MAFITRQEVLQLLEEQLPPCVSIYQPLHRTPAEQKQDSLKYRHLIDGLEDMTRSNYPASQVYSLIEKLHFLAWQKEFWTQGRDGIAILASPSSFHTFDLRAPVPTLAIVADSFHIKPLLRAVQSADRFNLLCLQRDRIRLYEGDRDGLVELKPAGVPLTVTDALGEEVVVQRKVLTRAGKSGESRPAPRLPGTPPGHSAKGADAKLDAEHFFRAVDEAVIEHVSRPSRLPLLVAALPEDWARFHKLSRNPQLLKAAIERSPSAMSDRQLLSEAWKCIEPHYLARLTELADQFRVGRPRGLASDDLLEVRRAAHQGRVSTLLIEADDDSSEGVVAGAGGASAPLVGDDPLDDLAEAVLRQKGNVVVVPAERMPTTTGLAATYRF